jgi:phenylacetic acid degradation operon negative regulatory protein
MSVTAKNITLDLLMAAGNDPLSVRHLLASAALFGIPANNLRVSLARLCADELIESVGRGVYRLSAKANALATDVATWRTACQRIQPWQGGYIAVHCGALGRSDRVVLRQRDRALQMVGLQALDKGLYVRPDNVEGGIDQVRNRLHKLGLEREACVFLASDFDAAREARIHHLWDGAALNAGYRATQNNLDDWASRAKQLPIEDAARESYLLGSKAIHQVVFDPLLPAPLVDAQARQSFVDAVIAFDQLGHEIWRHFHALVDAPHVPAPRDARPSSKAH